MSAPVDPAAEGAEMSFVAKMSYGDYLRLDEVLNAQKPLSPVFPTVCGTAVMLYAVARSMPLTVTLLVQAIVKI